MVTHRDHHVLLNLKVLSSHGIQASASADAPDHALPLAPHDVALADYTIWSALVYRESLDSSLLEHAARLALGKFPQLAGQLRLRKDGYDILCNNQGASFTTASCTNHLQEFLPPQVITHFKPVLVHAALKHIPQTAVDYISTSASLLHMVHLQLGGASCLIITLPHKLADLNSMRLFTQHWAWHYRHLQAQREVTSHAADTSRSTSSAQSSGMSAPAEPVYTRSLFDQVAAQGVSLHQACQQASSSPVPLTSRVWKRAAPADAPVEASQASQASAEDPASSQAAEQAAGDRDAAEEEYDEVFVHISQQQLKQLKQQAMQDMAAMASSSAAQQQALAPGQGTVTWVSSCDAMWAHVRKLLGKLSARAGKAFNLVFAMDMRQRVDCIPSGAFGNWILPLPTARLDPSSHTLGALAAELRQEILASGDIFCSECAYLQQQEQEGALLLLWRDISSMVTPSGSVILSNWDWSEADAEFGEGVVPVWVQGGGGTGGIFPNLLLAFRELGPGGGYWLQVCLHREPLQELRAVLKGQA